MLNLPQSLSAPSMVYWMKVVWWSVNFWATRPATSISRLLRKPRQSRLRTHQLLDLLPYQLLDPPRNPLLVLHLDLLPYQLLYPPRNPLLALQLDQLLGLHQVPLLVQQLGQLRVQPVHHQSTQPPLELQPAN